MEKENFIESLKDLSLTRRDFLKDLAVVGLLAGSLGPSWGISQEDRMEKEKSKIEGYYASQKMIEGEAIVLRQPLNLMDINPETGKFVSGEYEGRSIKGRIVVCPFLCGATVVEFTPYFLSLTGNKPKAIITTSSYAYTPVMSGSIFSETPLLYNLDEDLFRTIKTGDLVKINADKKEVILSKSVNNARR